MKTYQWGISKDEECPKEEGKEPRNEIFVREPSILETVRNRIYFYSLIDAPSILKLNRELRDTANHYLNEQQVHGTDEPVPIWLHIRSYGGSIFDGLAGMDEIIKCPVPVYTVVDGCCASAGTFLSIVGKKRYMNKHSFIMIHQLSSLMWGKYDEFQDEMDNLDMLMETIKSIYKEYTMVPLHKVDEILKHDLWFRPEKCLEYGLVDRIL